MSNLEIIHFGTAGNYRDWPESNSQEHTDLVVTTLIEKEYFVSEDTWDCGHVAIAFNDGTQYANEFWTGEVLLPVLARFYPYIEFDPMELRFRGHGPIHHKVWDILGSRILTRNGRSTASLEYFGDIVSLDVSSGPLMFRLHTREKQADVEDLQDAASEAGVELDMAQVGMLLTAIRSPKTGFGVTVLPNTGLTREEYSKVFRFLEDIGL